MQEDEKRPIDQNISTLEGVKDEVCTEEKNADTYKVSEKSEAKQSGSYGVEGSGTKGVIENALAEKNTGANKDFKEGLKTTGLFGGVQIFKILISIINSKFVAVLLGPAGMGIMGLLSSTTGIISNVSNMGLGTSAVRDVSGAFAERDKYKFNRIVSVFRRLVWLTGILGTAICFFGSPLWSKITFGNYNYTWAFAVLAITILLAQISSGQGVVLQGTRSFNYLAKSGVIGSALGLFTGIPLYFWLGTKGIVPAMIVSSITALCLTYYYSRKIKIERVSLTWKETFSAGSIMLKLGFFLALQGFLSTFCAYLVRIYISNTSSVADVGLYNSGFNIVNTYVGLVFTAMGTDYFPRLCTYSHDYGKFNNAVNQQIELSVLLLSPMIAAFLILGELAILILYSTKFLGVSLMITLGIFGVFFKAPGWCLGFTFVAKGDSRAFFWNELVSETYFLIFNILFYKLWGLNGLGLSFVINYIIYLIQVNVVCRKRYDFKLDRNILKSFVPQVFISLVIMLIVIFLPKVYRYTIGVALVCLSCYLAYRELSKRINVIGYIKNKIRK
jgi:O-antigen/teichoic acid export membrane protein